jgi:hypothetical protein
MASLVVRVDCEAVSGEMCGYVGVAVLVLAKPVGDEQGAVRIV